MNQQSIYVNKLTSKGRISSLSIDETNNVPTGNSSMTSLLHSFVDDIPFGLNPKYRTMHLANIDIDEFDSKPMAELLSRTFDFQVENQVLLEALEDVKRKKKEIETDSINPTVNKTAANGQTSSELTSLPSNTFYESIAGQSPSIAMSNLSLTTLNPALVHQPNGIRHQSPSNSYRLPSVRDIYWPTGNQQQYSIPANAVKSSSPSNTIIYPIKATSSIIVQQAPTSVLAASMPTLTPTQQSTTTMPTINPIRPTNRSNNNSKVYSTDDLTSAFDGTLTSDDPFHDAELRSLNDVAELNHLYATIGSANTIRR